MQLTDIYNTAVTLMGYPVSYAELVGTIAGLVCVYYAARNNIITWPTGIINEVCLFFVFYRVQLYADMVLQVFFLVVTLYGWYNWRTASNDKKVGALSVSSMIWLAIVTLVATAITGYFFAHIHVVLPHWFSVPAAYPYIDSLVMVMSVVATFLLARRKVENWYLWIAIDVICTILYYLKAVIFLSLEYLILLVIASYGLYNWRKQQHI